VIASTQSPEGTVVPRASAAVRVRRLLSLLAAVLSTTAAAAAGFDFQALQLLVQSQDLGSIEQLLAALPGLQRGNYALMFASRSLQGATSLNPRAILFGPDARFIITFNGDPGQRGFRTLETMQFDDSRSEFQLRELSFPEQPGGAAQVLVSEVNPPRCARCHGTPPRPVWDTFPLWPGAYGERYRATLSPRERSGLTAFLARQPTHARYRYLLGAGHLADPDTFRATAYGTYAGAQREPPNARLAIALGRLQSRAIVAQLLRQPAFATYQYALLGLADGNCGPLADFYPDALWREQRAAFMRFTAQAAEANAQQERLKQARATSNSGSLGVAADPGDNVLLRLRFVAETGLGTPTGEWTLALERGTYDFTMPPVSTQPLRDALLAQVITQDPVVRALSFSATSADGDRFCTHLKRRSRDALFLAKPVVTTGETSASAFGTADGVRPAVLQLCIGCHESGVAPDLPFSHPSQLAQALRTRPSAHGTLIDEIHFRLSPQAGTQRMPLLINLADAERRQLEDYFLAIAALPN
jgi:hypothetical protein